MTPTVHYYAPRQWNSPDGPPPEGWYLIDDDYPLHVYPIIAGPFDTPEQADRELSSWT